MWLSAETMIVPSGHGLVAACGVRCGDSAIPTISGISRTNEPCGASSAIVLFLRSADAVAPHPPTPWRARPLPLPLGEVSWRRPRPYLSLRERSAEREG